VQHTNKYEHIFYERRLDHDRHESILLRSGEGEDRSDVAWRQIQWGEPLF
jgi:hypothetical protein